MSEPLASTVNPTNLDQMLPGDVAPEPPYFCPLCGVAYNVSQNQTCYCHPRLEQ